MRGKQRLRSLAERLFASLGDDDLAADDSSRRLLCVFSACENEARSPNQPHNSHIYFPSGTPPPPFPHPPTALFQVSPSDLYEALTAAATAPDSDGKLVEMRGAVNVVAVVFEKERLGGWGGGVGGEGREGLKGSTGVGAEGTSEAASLTAAQLRPRPSGSSLRRGKEEKKIISNCLSN